MTVRLAYSRPLPCLPAVHNNELAKKRARGYLTAVSAISDNVDLMGRREAVLARIRRFMHPDGPEAA